MQRKKLQAFNGYATSPWCTDQVGPQKQGGAVLLLGLILLVVFSVLSVSSVEIGINNEKIAANHFSNQATFQLAESAAPYALAQNAWVNEAISRADESNNVVGAFTVPQTKTDEVLTVTLQASRVPMPGYSLLIDSGSRFVQVTTASDAAIKNGTPARVVQGFVRAGAG